MSVKDVKRYYDIITKQYFEMVDDLKDFEEAVSNKSFEQNRLEELRKK